MFTSLGVVSSLTFSIVLSLLLYSSVILDIIVIRFGWSDLLMARLADIDLRPSLSAYVFTFLTSVTWLFDGRPYITGDIFGTGGFRLRLDVLLSYCFGLEILLRGLSFR